MIQFADLLFSFFYGLVCGIIYRLLRKKKAFLKIGYFFVITLLYVFCFYKFNYADIHIYNKILLIIGFVFGNSYVKFSVKSNKNNWIL